MQDERRAIAPGIAIEDGGGIHFLDTALHRTLTAREYSQAYQVRVVDGTIQEDTVPIERHRLHD